MTLRGRQELRLSSSSQGLRLRNVRFVVEDGATLSVDLRHHDGVGNVRADTNAPAGTSSTVLTIEGASTQASRLRYGIRYARRQSPLLS